jgi:hypothetical protein
VSDSDVPRSPGFGPPVGLGELFVRHARKDGRSVAILRAVDHGDQVTVECEVFPHGSETATAPGPGPFRFAGARQATAFAIETVEALMCLGCDVQSQ